MQFIDISAGEYQIGLDPSVLSEDAWQGIDSFLPRQTFLTAFSPRRTVTVGAFQMATEPLSLDDLLTSVDDDDLDEVGSLEALCALVDGLLAPTGLRLATEDELEIACGGALFPWGNQIPDGFPYAGQTTFRRHEQPAPSGLGLNVDSYKCELVRTALKFGDGGAALCGGYPWPVPWLMLSPAYRVPDEFLENFFDWIEGATVRPVRMAPTA